MLNLKTINKENFCLTVNNLVDKGTTYLDAIMTVKNEYNLHEKEISKLLDIDTQAAFHREMINLNLLKSEEDDE